MELMFRGSREDGEDGEEILEVGKRYSCCPTPPSEEEAYMGVSNTMLEEADGGGTDVVVRPTRRRG